MTVSIPSLLFPVEREDTAASRFSNLRHSTNPSHRRVGVPKDPPSPRRAGQSRTVARVPAVPVGTVPLHYTFSKVCPRVLFLLGTSLAALGQELTAAGGKCSDSDALAIRSQKCLLAEGAKLALCWDLCLPRASG